MDRETWDIYLVEDGKSSVIQKELSLDYDAGWNGADVAIALGFSCHKVLEWGDPDEGDYVHFELYYLHENKDDPSLGSFEYLALEDVSVIHCILFKSIFDVNAYLATMAPIMSYQIQARAESCK